MTEFVTTGFQHPNGLVRAWVNGDFWVVECVDQSGEWTASDLKKVRLATGLDLEESRPAVEVIVEEYGRRLAALRDLLQSERENETALRAWLYEQREACGTLMPAEGAVHAAAEGPAAS